jgi:hypothetical protein
MAEYREIRADFDRDSIVVYQAYNASIADAAVKSQRFAPLFSMNRMTWIKPSFLWLMERNGWGTKSNQERTLAVRISRTGWERALSLGVLTSFEAKIHRTAGEWQQQIEAAAVHVQWDPERSLAGGKLDHRSIQVGLSRQIIEEYVNEWTLQIDDLTSRVVKIRELRRQGRMADAKKLLPAERVYSVEPELARGLGMV